MCPSGSYHSPIPTLQHTDVRVVVIRALELVYWSPKNHSETEELLFPTAMKANGESKANFKAPNMKEVQQLENKAQTWPGPGVLHTNN